jgi:ribosomal protein S18 acetylase RimI-like enzyme
MGGMGAKGDSDIIIRRAEARDLPALGQLGALMVKIHHGYDSARFMEPGDDVAEGYAWFLGTELGQEDVLVLVADLAGQVVGYVYAGLEPHSWKELREPAGFIHDLVVEESARRRGIATQLLESAAAWLETHGAPRVMLWTAQKNESAKRLFESLGFRRTMIEMTRERRS